MSRQTLTDDQAAAVTARKPLVFVESAPGSGKTTVATERFGILRHARHSPDHRGVVAVSFARSAVGELRGRVRSRWGDRSVARPNSITTMDALHRRIVQYLLATGNIEWPGGVTAPRLIDSWARQRGATRIGPSGPRNQRWELGLRDQRLCVEYRRVESKCWGMPYAKRSDYVDSLAAGVCTHDEIRQIVGLALGRPSLRRAIGHFLSRSVVHLVVDEAFDLNGLDVQLVRLAADRKIGITLVGDPWQALYEWRGARPDLVHRLLADYDFETMPMDRSFRFKTEQTRQLASDLRSGCGVSLPSASEGVDTVLAAEWEDLLAAGGDVIPVSFGQLECQTDASIALLLNHVTRRRLNTGALNMKEALRCLRREELQPDLELPLDLLASSSVPLERVMEELRLATKVEGVRKPALPKKRVSSRMDRLGLLRRWITTDGDYVVGLSFHQAKGREWDNVDVALDAKARRQVRAGLDNTNEDHRKLYVALTRARFATRLRKV